MKSQCEKSTVVCRCRYTMTALVTWALMPMKPILSETIQILTWVEWYNFPTAPVTNKTYSLSHSRKILCTKTWTIGETNTANLCRVRRDLCLSYKTAMDLATISGVRYTNSQYSIDALKVLFFCCCCRTRCWPVRRRLIRWCSVGTATA